MTLRQYLDGPLRWVLFECGHQRVWNELNQIIASQAGSSITGGTTVLSTASLTDGAGTGIQKDTTRSISGPFATTGGEATATGEQVPPSDPSGAAGPNPARLSQKYPLAGFRDYI